MKLTVAGFAPLAIALICSIAFGHSSQLGQQRDLRLHKSPIGNVSSGTLTTIPRGMPVGVGVAHYRNLTEDSSFSLQSGTPKPSIQY